MRPQLPRPSLGQMVQAVTVISIVANINWKGLKAMFLWLKGLFSGVKLPEYWGRMALIAIASLVVALVLFDWRRQAVEAVEARAALEVVTKERNILALKVNADEAARAERGRILVELAELNKKQLDELQETLDENPDWSNQPLPRDLRERLR